MIVLNIQFITLIKLFISSNLHVTISDVSLFNKEGENNMDLDQLVPRIKLILIMAVCKHDISVFSIFTVTPVKSDSDVMFCLQSTQGLKIDRSLVY